jgi:hypothetical protein
MVVSSSIGTAATQHDPDARLLGSDLASARPGPALDQRPQHLRRLLYVTRSQPAQAAERQRPHPASTPAGRASGFAGGCPPNYVKPYDESGRSICSLRGAARKTGRNRRLIARLPKSEKALIAGPFLTPRVGLEPTTLRLTGRGEESRLGRGAGFRPGSSS